ncbi:MULTISPECIES: MarR family transcriptional regulator [unclassified Acinetobacter]|uniref:MarR family winged helix-turn-helix transcriptional regulator n=1 Tax=unclassified Acinetobacter TaxID=196816 RepID=UPI0029350B0A|nr:MULTISPECIES: MarR family transcriptional regulator [unclassified Acinetobacter]WOE32486.1 MarR family transcriptional regulator [Acinetobacter sp. SAAs470]WOE37962.1 MarR family transcriptional regulator [Acinetobacter sp. SAAs474]
MSSEQDLFNFDTMLCFSLYSTTNAMMRNYTQSLAQLGLTYPQLLVLIALWKQNHVSSSELSQQTLFDLGSLSPIIKRLEKSGLVTITPDPNDRRRKYISLTQSGAKLKDPVSKIFADTQCKLNLSTLEIDTMLKIGQKIKKQLKQ